MPSTAENGSRVASIIACNTVMLTLASIGACARVAAQIFMRRLDADDVFFLISWVFAFVLCFVSMWMTHYGYGRHFALIVDDTETVATFLKLNYVTGIAYLVSITAIKISFCLLYLKVFSITTLRWLYYLLIVFVICEFIEEVFVYAFQCSPPKKYFYPLTVPGVCMDLYVFYYVSFAIKLATDIVLFLLPIPQLLKLHAPAGVRAGLIVMFGLGLLVCVTSIVRITYIRHFQVDFTWELVRASNWTSVEVCTFIIIASIPSVRKVLIRIFPTLRRLLHLPCSRYHQESGSSSAANNNNNNSPHVSPLDEGYFAATMAQRPADPITPDCFPLPSPELPEPRIQMMSLNANDGVSLQAPVSVVVPAVTNGVRKEGPSLP